MEVSLFEIVEVFEQLTADKLSREEASDWAAERCKARDERNLEFNPPSEEEVIWCALLYLLGVDLKSAPDAYLHSSNDFVEYLSKIVTTQLEEKRR